MRWLRAKRSPSPLALRDRFLQRYEGRALIVHAGFPPDWLAELMKQPGGAGYFRIDARSLERRRPSPVEWVVGEYLLPLELPLPLFVLVRMGKLLVRHLTRGGHAVHPSEILWFLDEIETRYHALLEASDNGFELRRGIDPEDNEALSMLGAFDLPT